MTDECDACSKWKNLNLNDIVNRAIDYIEKKDLGGYEIYDGCYEIWYDPLEDKIFSTYEASCNWSWNPNDEESDYYLLLGRFDLRNPLDLSVRHAIEENIVSWDKDEYRKSIGYFDLTPENKRKLMGMYDTLYYPEEIIDIIENDPEFRKTESEFMEDWFDFSARGWLGSYFETIAEKQIDGICRYCDAI